MEFVHVFIIFSVMVMVSLLWPLLKRWRHHKKQLRADIRSDIRDAVAMDRKSELEQAQALGEISAKELKSLEKDLERTIAFEDSQVPDGAQHAITFGSRSRNTIIVIAVLMPLLTILLYKQLGAKPDWEIAQFSRELAQSETADKDDYKALVDKVNQRLEQSPDNARLLFLLGNLTRQVGDYDESVRAYRKLKVMHPDSAVVLEELAQALFLRAGNIITDEVRQNTREALKLNANLPTALGIAGIDAFQAGNYQEAISFWSSAVRQLDPSSPASSFLSKGIARAELALEKSGKTKVSKPKTGSAGESIQVSVSLSDDISDLSGDEALFVYARAWQGAKMPLAIQRMTVADLPAKIVLDKSMAMAQGMDIGSAAQLEVVARVSRSGSAAPQSGDWSASFGPVILSDKLSKVSLEISEQIP